MLALLALGAALSAVATSNAATEGAPGPTISQPSPLAIPAGRFAPLFGLPDGWPDLAVAAFQIDETPVTTAAFAAFVAKYPAWAPATRRGRAFADSTYLTGWSDSGQPPANESRRPVTSVSWYAARAFCKAAGGRLASTLEWEYVAAATPTRPDGAEDPVQTEKILAWYARPAGTEQLRDVKSDTPNFYGAYDLHGLVWEWTDDFNGSFVASDSRGQNDRIKDLVCGAGSLGAARSTDYAAYMRYAMRSSLEAHFAQNNLGFRCAYDKK